MLTRYCDFNAVLQDLRGDFNVLCADLAPSPAGFAGTPQRPVFCGKFVSVVEQSSLDAVAPEVALSRKSQGGSGKTGALNFFLQSLNLVFSNRLNPEERFRIERAIASSAHISSPHATSSIVRAIKPVNILRSTHSYFRSRGAVSTKFGIIMQSMGSIDIFYLGSVLSWSFPDIV